MSQTQNESLIALGDLDDTGAGPGEVVISAADTTPQVLSNKIAPGQHITKPGG